MPENEVTMVALDAAAAAGTDRAEILRAPMDLAVMDCDTEPPATTDGALPLEGVLVRAAVTVTVALAVAVPLEPVQLTE
jgi:hypothetical protein